MLPIHKIIWYEMRAENHPARVPEPSEAMEDPDQIRSYVDAYEWGGPFSAVQLHHLRELSQMIRRGDTVLDLACGPGPLLLELAPLYPDCRFIGADLSQPMLDVLRERAAARGVSNVEILHEDIRTLPSLAGRRIDLVITTLAFHHLPTVQDLETTLRRVDELLGPSGGFYVFDFGLLRSSRTRALLVAEAAKTAQPKTVKDYDLSLQAAFPLDEVVRLARGNIHRPFRATSSSFVDFFYFLQTASRATTPTNVESRIAEVWKGFSMNSKIEYRMLRLLRRHR